MMKLLIALALVATASALIRDQACPDNVVPREGFNQQLYLGLWYEIERYDDNPATLRDSDCNTATFSTNADQSKRIWNEARLDGVTWQQFGTARLVVAENETVTAVFDVAFEGADGNPEGEISQLIILSTDYINYSLVYSCKDLPDGSSNEGFWFLSRSPGMPTRNPTVLAGINAIIDRHILRSELRETNQDFAFCTGTSAAMDVLMKKRA